MRELLEAKRDTDSLFSFFTNPLSPENSQLVITDKCLYEGIPTSGFSYPMFFVIRTNYQTQSTLLY